MIASTRRARGALLGGLAVAAPLTAAGCSNSQSPAIAGPQFSTQVGINTFQQRLDSGPARVRITLADTGLVAVRVNIHRPDQLDRPERIEGPITDITVNGADGNITLAVGGLVVGFNDSTRFGAADDGEDRHGDEQESVEDSVRDTLRWGGGGRGGWRKGGR